MFMIKKFQCSENFFILCAFFFIGVFGVSIKSSVSNSDLKVGDSVEITAAVTYQGSQFKSFKFLNGITPIAELKSSSPSNFSITTEGKQLFGDRVSVKSKAYTFTMSILNLTVADSMTITMEFVSKVPLVTVTEKINIVVTANDAKSVTTRQLLDLYNISFCYGQQKLNSCLLPEEKICKVNEIVNSSFLIKTLQEIMLLSKIVDEIVLNSTHAKNILVGTLNLVDKLLEVNISLLSGAQTEYNSSRNILSTLDSLATLMAKELKEYSKLNYNVSNRNIGLSVGIVKKEDVYITAYKNAEKENRVAISNNLSETYLEELASIFIPGNAFGNTNNSIYSFFYKKPQFFTTNEKLFIKDSKQSPNTAKIGVAVSAVLSASVMNQRIQNLTNPISIKFKKINPKKLEGRFDCYFWSVKYDAWSNIGCRKLNESNLEVHCECDHLTNFALILDVSQSNYNPPALKWLSWIGCTISLVGLSLTLFNLIFFKKLRQKLPMKILICLCTSLFLLLVIFLAGAKRGSSSLYSCRVVAGMLHYFVLTTFCWTAVEGVNLYRNFVIIYKKDNPLKFMVVSSVFAWGCPLVVVLITDGIADSSYIGNEFCIIQGNYFIFGLLTPVAVIFFTNISILVLVMIGIKKHYTKGNDYKNIVRLCRIAFSCSVLLGLTWVFAVGSMENTFQVLFIIFNSMQGFFLFLIYVAQNPDIQTEWRHLMADTCIKRKNDLDIGVNNSGFNVESSKNNFSTICSDLT